MYGFVLRLPLMVMSLILNGRVESMGGLLSSLPGETEASCAFNRQQPKHMNTIKTSYFHRFHINELAGGLLMTHWNATNLQKLHIQVIHQVVVVISKLIFIELFPEIVLHRVVITLKRGHNI